MERTQTAGIERILAILDPGSFAQIGAYVGKNTDGTDLTGLICGYGAINGRLV